MKVAWLLLFVFSMSCGMDSIPLELPVRVENKLLEKLLNNQLNMLSKSLSQELETGPKISKVDYRGSYFSLSHLFILEEYKLAFCAIPKVGSTLFKQLLMRISGNPFWFDHTPHNKWIGVKLGWQVSPERMKKLFVDPTWTKAIFFRDPVKRLRSSFEYLFQHENGTSYNKEILLTMKSGNGLYVNKSQILNESYYNFTWEEFLPLVTSAARGNVHWNPQTHFCGFHKYYPYYNFIGQFEKLTEHGKLLFDRLSPNGTLWELYGSKGWAAAEISYGTNATDRSEYTGKNANVTELLSRAPMGYNTVDCIFCKNYAYHKSNTSNTDNNSNSSSNSNSNNGKRRKQKKYSLEDWNTIRNSTMFTTDYFAMKLVTSGDNSPGPMKWGDYDIY